MTDTPDATRRQYPPDLDFISRPPGPYDRLPVLREDYEIENEVFSYQPLGGHKETTSKRTSSEIPRYLTKAFYSSGSGSAKLLFLVRNKADRVCKREYLHDESRDLGELYGKAEDAFRVWWSHLEDDEDEETNETDGAYVKQNYVKTFVDIYIGRLLALDREHRERKEAAQKQMKDHAEYVKKFGRTGGPPYTEYSRKDYNRSAPRWKQNVAAEGRKGGSEAAEEDIEIGIGFRDGTELEKLAQERFKSFWLNMSLDYDLADQAMMFDYPGLRMIYIHNFMRTYTERVAGGQFSSGRDAVSARVVTTQPGEDARVYVIEINDPQNLSEPVQVEVAIETKDNPEMQG